MMVVRQPVTGRRRAAVPTGRKEAFDRYWSRAPARRIASAHSGYSHASLLAVSPGGRLSLRELPGLHLAWVKVGDKDALQHVPVLGMSPDPRLENAGDLLHHRDGLLPPVPLGRRRDLLMDMHAQPSPSNHKVTGINAAPVCTASAAGPPVMRAFSPKKSTSIPRR